MKLNTKALAFTFGICWGAGIFLATLWIMLRGGQSIGFLENLYIGYSVSFVGSLIGLVWGFVDGFISGWIVAWLYNKFAK